MPYQIGNLCPCKETNLLMRLAIVSPTPTTSTAKQEMENQDYNIKNKSIHPIILAGWLAYIVPLGR